MNCVISSGDLFTCQNNAFFSRVKISCFRAKTFLFSILLSFKKSWMFHFHKSLSKVVITLTLLECPINSYAMNCRLCFIDVINHVIYLLICSFPASTTSGIQIELSEEPSTGRCFFCNGSLLLNFILLHYCHAILSCYAMFMFYD